MFFNSNKKIVLTGIHLGTYGLGLKPKVTLSELIKTILKQTTIMRIRLSSVGVCEICEIDDELLDLLTDKSKRTIWMVHAQGQPVIT